MIWSAMVDMGIGEGLVLASTIVLISDVVCSIDFGRFHWISRLDQAAD